jgi:hypothetical protein
VDVISAKQQLDPRSCARATLFLRDSVPIPDSGCIGAALRQLTRTLSVGSCLWVTPSKVAFRMFNFRQHQSSGSSASLSSEVDAPAKEEDVGEAEDGGGDPPGRLAGNGEWKTHIGRTLRKETVGPHQAAVAAEGGGDGGKEKDFEAERIEGASKAVERAGCVIGKASYGVVERSIGVVGAEGLEQAGNDLNHEAIKHGPEKRHPDAKSDVVGKPCDDLLPITKAQNAGEEEVTCAIHEVKATQQPEEVAEVSAMAGEMGREHGKRTSAEVD